MKQEPKVEIKVDANKVYQVTISVDELGLRDMLVTHGRHGMTNHNFYFEKEVTKLFAQEYVKLNFDTIASLIDIDTVKLLATRELANVVSANTN